MDFTITIPNDKVLEVGKAFGIFIDDYETNEDAIDAFKDALLRDIRKKTIRYKKRVAFKQSPLNADEITLT